MHYTYHYDSPLGGITLASDGVALIGLWFDGQKYFKSTLSYKYEEKILPIFNVTIKWLDIYFSGNNPNFTPLLHLKTTPFRKTVWEVLASIPFGETMNYKEIAIIVARQKKINKMSAQAIGQAVGHNPISLIIPCHRVIGTDGNLIGYAGGIEKKIKLLFLEK